SPMDVGCGGASRYRPLISDRSAYVNALRYFSDGHYAQSHDARGIVARSGSAFKPRVGVGRQAPVMTAMEWSASSCVGQIAQVEHGIRGPRSLGGTSFAIHLHVTDVDKAF